MKKTILIIIGIAALVLLTACNGTPNLPICGDGVCENIEMQTKTCPDDCFPSDCADLGEHGPNPSLGPNDPNADVVCCSGLVQTVPSEAFTDTCEMAVGAGTVCLACGDGVCDEMYENGCNCPDDCNIKSGPVCGNDICEEGEADDCPVCVTEPCPMRPCTLGTCQSDCDVEPGPVCGNDICEEGEADDCPVCTGDVCPERPCKLGTCQSDCGIEKRISCEGANKGPDVVCTMEYAPVCGYWTADDGSLESKTYSNGCTGCSAEKVEYVIDGAC